MKAKQARLPQYTGTGRTVYAAKITGIGDMQVGPHGARKLLLDNGKEVNLIAKWMEGHAPEVGGYYVVEDIGGDAECRYCNAAEFERSYVRTQEEGHG